MSYMNDVHDVTIEPLVCGRCGANLPEPRAFERSVKCEYCGTLHLITHSLSTGMGGRAFTATTMTGVNFMATKERLEEKVKEALLSSKCPPVDVFSGGEIVEIRCVGVPAYWFDDCTVRGHIMFEKSYTYTTTHEEGTGDDRHTVTETNVEWRPHTMEVSEVRDFVVSASKRWSEIIKTFYYSRDINASRDIGYLANLNVEDVAENDIPDSSAFIRDINPELESMMLKLAQNKLLPSEKDSSYKIFGVEIKKNSDIRNITVNGVEIDRKNPALIWIALCEVKYRYQNQSYTFYISHDGKEIFGNEVPVDNERHQRLEELGRNAQDVRKWVSNRLFMFNFLTVAVLISGLCVIFGGTSSYETVYQVLGVIGGLLLVVAGIMIFRFCVSESNRLRPMIEEAERRYEEMCDEFENAPKEVYAKPEVYDKIRIMKKGA